MSSDNALCKDKTLNKSQQSIVFGTIAVGLVTAYLLGLIGRRPGGTTLQLLMLVPIAWAVAGYAIGIKYLNLINNHKTPGNGMDGKDVCNARTFLITSLAVGLVVFAWALVGKYGRQLANARIGLPSVLAAAPQ